MKKIVFILAVITSFQASAQLTLESGRYLAQKVVRLQGQDAELFQKAKAWVAANTNPTQDKTFFDEDANKIIVNAMIEHDLSGIPSVANYTLVLEFRNNMYRETFKDFTYKTGNKVYLFEDKKLKSKSKIVKDISLEIETFSENLQSSMYSELMAKKTQD
ncbi:DUF4468 domain-containing protein [Reichenbachiella agarivorans]|uniref:DUF4468 domain-containing protein n=1 Tax=Reichenbachiella agarivorans TaxID=2979464 RepID=A0ABY6CNS2_9BACT|nr:DUF4468 domain-containing protein [Reichenbachiella agarivorans]UXP32165.1 DUF4468 domain-containing protein [Reichenbachiella agarivorans]